MSVTLTSVVFTFSNVAVVLVVDSHENSAKEQTGAQVPSTVTNKHGFRPTTSDNFPNNGQDTNANSPRMHSATPMTM